MKLKSWDFVERTEKKETMKLIYHNDFNVYDDLWFLSQLRPLLRLALPEIMNQKDKGKIIFCSPEQICPTPLPVTNHNIKTLSLWFWSCLLKADVFVQLERLVRIPRRWLYLSGDWNGLPYQFANTYAWMVTSEHKCAGLKQHEHSPFCVRQPV